MNTKTDFDFEYSVIRSDRKTLAVEVKRDGTVVVRSPRFLSERKISAFLLQHNDWILKTVEKQRSRQNLEFFDEEKILELKKTAKEVLPLKVEYYSALMGVKPTAVHITSAKTRYGSCSSKNSINFSLYLMTKSERCIDYVVVHELAHIIHHNHSKEFYKVIESVLPDYKQRIKELKQ